MSDYRDFARFYDALTLNIDYLKRTQYLCTLFDLYNFKPNLILDLACGTGSFAINLHDLGYDMIACDSSVQMLSAAKNKAALLKKDILFLHQSMTDFDLYGTVDCVVCCLDSINHLILKSDVKRTFEKVSLFLNPGGLFIFDVNTIYKHNSILADNTFIYDLENLFCVWQNSLLKNNLIKINLDFFERENSNYNRYTEEFYEKAYSIEEILLLLKQSGLNILGFFDELTLNEPNEKSQRIFFVAGKPAV